MALREVKPLNPVQWKQVTDALKAGPNEEQKRAIAQARARAKELKQL